MLFEFETTLPSQYLENQDDVAAALLSALGGEPLAASSDAPVRLELTDLSGAGLSVTDRSVHGMMLAVCVNGEYQCFLFCGILGFFSA